MKTLAKHSLIAARWVVPLAVLGGLAWVVLRTNPEPVYQGKRLGEWLAGYHGQQSPETEEAVRRLGTNAIPTLLRMLRVKDSKVTASLVSLARKQRLIKFEYRYDFQKNSEAANAFDILGADAKEAVPELIKIFEQNISAKSQSYTAWSLGGIGPPAAKAIPTLLEGTTNTYPPTRCNAVSALGKIHGQPELVVPALTKSLKDPDREVRASTIRSLELFGSDAKPAVSGLIQALNDQDPLVRKHAQIALTKIDPEAAAKLGVRTTTLVRTRAGWEVSK